MLVDILFLLLLGNQSSHLYSAVVFPLYLVMILIYIIQIFI